MAPPTDKKTILDGFRKQIQDGKPIVGAGAGNLLSLSDHHLRPIFKYLPP